MDVKKRTIAAVGFLISTFMLSAQNFSVVNNVIRFYSPDVKDTVRMTVIADTHLSMSDSREDPYRDYSKRMAAGYKTTKHFQTGEETYPQKAFTETIALAEKNKSDGIAILGDMFSYPSEAAIEWAMNELNQVKVPFYYICGNHDWHYEGMAGSSKDLRSTWVKKRLLPMFQGNNPLCYSKEIKGVRFLFVDNGIYEILPEQLAFIEKEIATGKPLVLMMHIPLYAEGRNVFSGCGHPDWNAAHDPYYPIERREQWPAEGHTEVTMKFYDSVLNAPNMMCIFAGHLHPQSMDMINGVPQFMVPANANAGYYDFQIIPKRGTRN